LPAATWKKPTITTAFGNHSAYSRRSHAAPSPTHTPTSSGANPAAASSRSSRRATGESPLSSSAALSTAAKTRRKRRARTDPSTVRRPPAPSGSVTHSAPTFASRVRAAPSFPARPAVSDDRAGTPVPSSATLRISPSFNDLRSGAASRAAPPPASPSTVIDPDSASSRRVSTSSPTARVARSMHFAP